MLKAWTGATAALAAAVGCAHLGATRQTPTLDGETPVPPVVRAATLSEGDVIETKVFREPGLTGVYRIGPAGEIDFPLIGKVVLQGRDADQVGEDIRTRLADGFLKNPQVTVFVREHNSVKVHVLGHVKKPGTFAYDTGMTAIQAVANAGGFARLAAKNRVMVTRVVDGAEQRFLVAVEDIGEGKIPDFGLLPGDIVFVPEAIF